MSRESDVRPSNSSQSSLSPSIGTTVQDRTTQPKWKQDSFNCLTRKISDLDQFANRIPGCGAELNSNHPGFADPVDRERRKLFADIALNYKHGEKIRRIEYTEKEIAAWRAVYKELVNLYPTHACAEFNSIFPVLGCDYPSPFNVRYNPYSQPVEVLDKMSDA